MKKALKITAIFILIMGITACGSRVLNGTAEHVAEANEVLTQEPPESTYEPEEPEEIDTLGNETNIPPAQTPEPQIEAPDYYPGDTHTYLPTAPINLTWVHGFYAFGAFGQRGLIHDMDSVSFGWSVMEWDEENGARLNTSTRGGNQWRIPEGYELIANYPRDNGARTHLNIFMDTTIGLSELIACEESRSAAVAAIIYELTRVYAGLGRNPFDGVTINFEGLRGERAKGEFTAFLTELSYYLRPKGLTLYVTVHPATIDGIFFDGYDYRAIGQLADRVILMTHDYHPRSLDGLLGTTWQRHAALTPIGEVRRSLEAITHPVTGVEDTSIIAIAFSFQNVGWFIDDHDRAIYPIPITVSNETVLRRMAQPDTFFGWSATYRNPYIIYTTENGQRVFLWYQNSQSVAEKIQLANQFGITGASVWRMGIVPNETEWDVWEVFRR